MERIDTIVHDELKELLVELKATDKDIVDQVNKSEEAKQLFDKTIMIRQKLVDKMKPIIELEYEDKLDEFEVLADLSLTEEGEINVKIVNELEMWKNNKRKAKEVKVAEPQAVDSAEEVEKVVAEIAE